MSVVFEKYSDKSFAVRGKLLEESDKRKELSKQFQGSCIWNSRLKGGPGLLVPINDKNKSILENLVKEKDEDSIRVDSDDEDKSPVKVDSDDDSPPRKSPPRKKRHDDESPRRDRYSDDESPRRKKRNDSDDDSDNSDNSDKRTPRRSRERDSRSSSDKKYHRSRSPVSSSSEDDSSEDERIQYTIRRRDKNNKEEKEELDTTIDSDVEDVVSISRRLRHFERRIKDLEKRCK